MDIKKGDVVHVRGTVTRGAHEGAHEDLVVITFSGVSDLYIAVRDIVHVEPRPLAVGDEVEWEVGWKARIACIDGDEAWVNVTCSDSTGFRFSHTTMKLNGLVRTRS